MGDKATSQSQLSNSNTSSTSNNTAAPNPFIQPMLQNQIQQLQNWQTSNPTAPNQTVVPMSQAQDSANQTAWQWGNSSLQNLGSSFAPATKYLSDAANGKYLDLSNNPYFQGAISASLKPVTENFTNNLIPNLRSTFAGAGRAGGGAEQDKINTAFTNFDRAAADAATTAGNQAYGMERGLQSGAASALPGVLNTQNSTAQGWLQMLHALGLESTADTQNRADVARSNFYTQPDFLTGMAQRYLGMYPGGQTNGTTTGTSQSSGYSTGSQGGGFGSFLGPALGIAGLGLTAFGGPAGAAAGIPMMSKGLI